MWRCCSCGESFPAPHVLITKEDVDGEGHYEKRLDLICPCCGEEFIEKEDEDG